VARPFDVVAGVVEHHRLAAVADFVADRLVNFELAAGVEPELDPVLDQAGDPALLGHPRDRRKAHAGGVADAAQHRAKTVVVGEGD
jgi:hypothetical protein